MTKTKKRIIWISILVISILIIFVGGYYLKMKSEISKMHCSETQEIVKDSLFCLKDGYCNVYLVKKNDTYVISDAGNDLESVKNELSKLNIDPKKVSAVFLTHTDGDHVASIPLFKNATIYLSKDEEQMINGKISRFFLFNNDIGKVAYKTLLDGETITINNITVKGILTPGHTIGSMCYVVDGKYLITGDAAALENGKLTGFSGFFNMDTKTALQSMEKLKNIPGIEYICTSHSGFAQYKTVF